MLYALTKTAFGRLGKSFFFYKKTKQKQTSRYLIPLVP